MEDVFLLRKLHLSSFQIISRNPCYNGRCISTNEHKKHNSDQDRVAILVIMEDVFLRNLAEKLELAKEKVAILVIMEDVFLH